MAPCAFGKDTDFSNFKIRIISHHAYYAREEKPGADWHPDCP